MLKTRVAVDYPKKGVIVRIRCSNFVTYNEVECCPGEKLNIILGPNGTGKSTLVCAIVLGLNGKVKVIGKSTDLHQYIKMGQKEASIEIELHNPLSKNYKIRRTFNTDNKTQWFLNDEKVAQKMIDKVVKECKIQVDNLCQFLPQDRVQDFAKMNKKELLDATQKSIDNGALCEKLNFLKSRRKEQEEFEKHVDAIERNLLLETQRNAAMEGEVRNAAEREENLKKLETMRQKQAHLSFNAQQELYKTVVDKMKETKKEQERIYKIEQEIEKQITIHKRKILSQEEIVNSFKNQNRSKLIELRELLLKSADLTESLEVKKNELKVKLTMEQTREEQKRIINKHIERFTNDLIETDGSDQNTYETISQKYNEINGFILEVQGQDEDLNYSIQQKNNELTAIASRIDQESNARSVKMQLLKQSFPEVYAAVLWLQENKNEFRGQVFEPMFLHLNIEEGFGKYVENVVSNADLIAFTCEYASDTSKLIRELRTKRKYHGINVVTAPENTGPAKQVYKPQVPLQNIRHLGFHRYLLDVIDAPEPILRFLAKYSNLSNIPVGDASVAKNIEQIPQNIRVYFSDDSGFRSKVSKYSKNVSLSSSGLQNPRFLRSNVNMSRLENYQRQKETLMGEKEQLTKLRPELQTQLKNLQQQLVELNAQKIEVKKKLDQQKIVRNKLESKRRELRALDDNKINPEAEKAKFQAVANKIVQDILQLRGNILNANRAILNITMDYKIHKILLDFLKETVYQKAQELSDFKKSCRETLEKIKTLEESVQAEKTKCRRLLESATELCNGIKPNDPAFKNFAEKFASFTDNYDELDTQIHETQARVDISRGSNPNSLKEFENRKKKIKQLIADKASAQQTLDDLTQEMAVNREAWYPVIKSWVKKIDAKFCNYFSKFNCAGKVELSEGSNENDYDEYGIRIRVSFRAESELQDLDAHTQSGGERAVSTAIYMLSLQNLTDVPFRVVDEINQGMDSSNERRVFDLLVSSITSESSSQYFLLTPKLLENLNYSEDTTILNVYNGPYVMNYQKWDLSQFINNRLDRRTRYKKRKLDRTPANDENIDVNRMH